MIHVLAIGAGVREALEALGALEGLFAAVQPLVFSQMMLVLERSWTLHTFIKTRSWKFLIFRTYSYNALTGMFILVSRKGTVFGKCFLTPITEIKTLLVFCCCRDYFRLWCNFVFAFCVRLILILKYIIQ
ncbi:hypothetical protein ALC62_03479 [Cyphomyrmex costatus]|uniref:Uncharacterized protein n=1 Tax=Cyphomyrmex costatus TaxID=456900 RepID=A0A151ILQ4_9HYME|nr:hypothetical protein ALC62_03479 [Cyphomyrmex costatus]